MEKRAPGKLFDLHENLREHRERAERLDAERLFAMTQDEKLASAIREVYRAEFYRRADICNEEAEGIRSRPNQSVWDAFPPHEHGSKPQYRYRYAAQSTIGKEVSMDTRRFSGGKFLKASAIPQVTRLRIASVKAETIGDDEKLVVRFDEFGQRGLALNATNTEALQGLFGFDSDSWIDQVVELYPTETDFKGKSVPCLRMRGVPSGAAVRHTEIREDDIAAGVTVSEEERLF